jgi:metal-responsive CopG/Arc/MetJ family transcriptional regulator
MTSVILPFMKTAVSLPDELFHDADRMADRTGLSRSELYARALREYLDRHRGDGVREALDAVYGGAESRIDPGIARAQAAVLDDEDW